MTRRFRGLWPGLALALLMVGPAKAQNFETALAGAADAIAAAVEESGRQRVAVIDFDEIEGQVTALGRFLAEEISANLAERPRAFRVVDRANLQSILAEHALSMSGLVNPENARRLGQIAGVDALILGTYTDFGETYRLSLKAIATDTAEMVASARTNLPKTKALELLAGSEVEQRGPMPSTPGAAEPAPEPDAPPPSAQAAALAVLYETGVGKGGFEGWSLTPDWKRLNGMLVNDGTGRGAAIASYQPPAADYVVEAQVRVLQDPAGYTSSFGVVVRSNNEEGYALGIWRGRARGNEYSTICYLEKEVGRNSSGCGHDGNNFNPERIWRTYRIEVKGNTLTLTIDDSVIASLADNRFLTPGQVGLWSKGYQVEVRSFRLLSLEQQAAAPPSGGAAGEVDHAAEVPGSAS